MKKLDLAFLIMLGGFTISVFVFMFFVNPWLGFTVLFAAALVVATYIKSRVKLDARDKLLLKILQVSLGGFTILLLLLGVLLQ